MQVIEIKDNSHRQRFHALPHLLYRRDPLWIPHLEKDVEEVFREDKNPSFQHGEAIRWILTDNKGNTIGRVAAFINRKALESMEYPVGGMGFFECINDRSAAIALFDSCKKWLEERGISAMDGPINFGERDRFWGLLIDSNEPPTYLESYNMPYYKQFFEDYGFKVYFEQHTYGMQKSTFNIERLGKVAAWVTKKGNYRFEHFRLKHIEAFTGDFVYIYNHAWSKFENFKPVSDAEILRVFESLKPIVIEEFIWFAYVDNEPAGFIVMLPDVNQLFKYVRGKMDLIGKLKFLYYKYRRPMNKVKGLVFGVLPKYHNHGLDAVLVYHFAKEAYQVPQYQHAEIAWVGDFNPRMESLMKSISGQVVKTHRTYRKIFDKNIDFKPFKLGKYQGKS
ncbi:MAG: hypothetical protein M3Q97_03800 [Bacteroidota bacterium]|nr:hypothetical protein [Bacteroidota bacterium]